MIPLRSQIRHAVIHCLKQEGSLWQDRVFESPLHPLNPEQLPLLIVTVAKDRILDDWTSILMTTLASNALIQMHELVLTISIVVKATESFVDEMDLMACQIKTLLFHDAALKALRKDLRFYGSEDKTEASDPALVQGLNLDVGIWYRTVESLPHAPYP